MEINETIIETHCSKHSCRDCEHEGYCCFGIKKLAEEREKVIFMGDND